MVEVDARVQDGNTESWRITAPHRVYALSVDAVNAGRPVQGEYHPVRHHVDDAGVGLECRNLRVGHVGGEAVEGMFIDVD